MASHPDSGPAGDEIGAADELATSAALGRQLAALLDSDTPVPGVTSGALRPEMSAIAVPSTTDGGSMVGDDFDVYLNERACWRNVPASVWNYNLRGYQVLKKWLSYRERKVLGRGLRPEEVRHFVDTAWRIASILKLVN